MSALLFLLQVLRIAVPFLLAAAGGVLSGAGGVVEQILGTRPAARNWPRRNAAF